MQSTTPLNKIGRLFFLILLVNSIGYISSYYMTLDTRIWYHNLPLSKLNPPNYIFVIVWFILLLLQAISAFLVWGKASPRYFVLQLAFNMMWSFVFFYLRHPNFALTVILLFLISLAINIYSYWKVSKLAASLLIPTFIWALFAVYLNAAIIF